MEGEKGTVCVTGGTGFIGSWLIKSLLDQGYNVRTTIRSNPEQKRDVGFLTSLPGASEKLKIFNAELSDPESFSAAIEGCIGVFHLATPVDYDDTEHEDVVTKGSINAALGVLKVCLNAKTVKRVVFTSSASAVLFNGKEVDEMEESFWTNADFVKALKPYTGSYAISKTLTEKAVLEFGETHGLDVVTIVPSFVNGPFFCPKFPSSVRFLLAMVLGDQEHFKSFTNTCLVHVDDVARAHIFLLEYPNAKGRYICSSDVITIERMSEFLSAKYPEFEIPKPESLQELKGYKLPGLSSKKLLDAGFKFKHGLDEMYDGAIKCCKEKGYL